MAKAVVTVVGKTYDQSSARLTLELLVLYDDGASGLRAETVSQSFGAVPQNLTDAIALNRLRQYAQQVVSEAWGATIQQNDVIVLP